MARLISLSASIVLVIQTKLIKNKIDNMIFDQLMEFIEGDEEMGEIELNGSDGRIEFSKDEGNNILNFHVYSVHETEFDLIKEVLDSNGMKYYTQKDEVLDSEKITVDTYATCIFSSQGYSGDVSDFMMVGEAEYILLVDAYAHLQIVRKSGKKELEITFFVGTEELNIVSSFLNFYGVNFSKSNDEFMGDQLKVELDVSWNFLPMKAKRLN